MVIETQNPSLDVTDSLCSLNEAIINANNDVQLFPDCPAGSGADVIDLGGRTIIFSTYAVNDENEGKTATPIITSDITIQNGALEGNRGDYRIFNVSDGDGLTFLEKLTLINVYIYGAGSSNQISVGSVVSVDGGELNVENSTIKGNIAEYGGVFAVIGSNVQVVNSVITGNAADYGGVFWSLNGAVTTVNPPVRVPSQIDIINSTIAGNNATFEGGAIDLSGTQVNIRNTVLWRNEAGVTGYDDQFDVINTDDISVGVNNGVAPIDIRHSLILTDTTYFTGMNNIQADPGFINPRFASDAPTTFGDYHIAGSSQLINAGDNTYVVGTTDIDGEPRVQDDTVDIGADEQTGDCARYNESFIASEPYVIGTVTNPDDGTDLVRALECASLYFDLPVTIDLDNRQIDLLSSYASYDGETALPEVLYDVTLQNGTLNSTTNARLLFVQQQAQLVLENMVLQGGVAPFGGAILSRGDLIVRNSRLQNNEASGNPFGSSGGAISAGSKGTLTIENSIFQSNNASFGGAITNRGTMTVRDSIFAGNVAGGFGGAIENRQTVLTVVNTLFSGNEAGIGSSIYNYGDAQISARARLTHVTITGNKDELESDATIYNGGSLLGIDNSIIWGNSTASPILNQNAATTLVRYSLVEGDYEGEGNFDLNPQFIAPMAASLAPTTDGDYHLQVTSPAINAGRNTLAVDEQLNSLNSDFDGDNRIRGGTADIGFDETGVRAMDINNDSIISPSDIIRVVNRVDTGATSIADIDNDGDVDNVDVTIMFDAMTRYILQADVNQ